MYSTIRARAFGLLVVLASACSGTIDPGTGGAGNAPGGPGGPGGPTPGGPNDPVTTGGTGPGPSFPPPVPSAMCTSTKLPAPRVWRLTHQQFDNTLKDTFGFTVPAAATLPQESRLDGFANASERLAVSSVLLESYNRAAEQVAA